MFQIPKVSYRNNNMGKLLSSALSEIGFVIITDHPIKLQLIEQAYSSWKIFFNSTEKESYLPGTKKPKGFYDYWKESSEFKKLGIPKESFYYSEDQPFLGCHKNISLIIEKLYEELNLLSSKIIQLLCENSPPLVKIGIETGLSRGKYSSLRAIFSPPLEGNNLDIDFTDLIRNPAHQDIDVLTLLPTATQPGLQVFFEGKWINVVSNVGDIIINNGDTLNLLSNGFYKSTTHRVIYNEQSAFNPRYAMAFFIALGTL
ncbi:dioxygenase isopenicillin N synthase (plasmid) [Candidatus Megaera polyxenophila]|nr:dioxygenase isopenicillin N synthase [Candidatus Megaera polyxenophila]